MENWVVQGALAAVFVSSLWFFGTKKSLPELKKVKEQQYDYIVVGGGTAGSIVAARLSENPAVKVLLIEAGTLPTLSAIKIPAAVMDLLGSNVDWRLPITPLSGCYNRVIPYPRGKVLGGCSSINWMLWVWGHADDFEVWKKEYGCEGWGYADVLPFFQKCESFKSEQKSKIRGENGPIEVQYPKKGELRVFSPVYEGFRKAGFPAPSDYNGGDMEGVHYAQTNIYRGERRSTYECYLKPLASRKNLTILTGHQVTRIKLENKKAVGVFVASTKDAKPENYQEVLIRANREVIISAGAIHTPHILLNSGIGPRTELEQHGIEVIADLPVGMNLQDHMMIGMQYEISEKINPVVNIFKLGYWIIKYMFTKSGQMASQGLEVLAFFQSFQPYTGGKAIERSHVRGNQPDIEIHVIPTAAHMSKKELLDKFGIHTEPLQHGFMLLPTLLHPQSRGRVQLQSQNPLDHPKIDLAYLTHPHDIEVLVNGCNVARRVVATGFAKGFVVRECENPQAGVSLTHPDYLEKHIRSNLQTVYHPVGTARMGKLGDPQAVVDLQLKVQGIQSLRVIDASIMPELTSGNTNAPAAMIGEKGAYLILQELNSKLE